jgi:hypothetical protein
VAVFVERLDHGLARAASGEDALGVLVGEADFFAGFDVLRLRRELFDPGVRRIGRSSARGASSAISCQSSDRYQRYIQPSGWVDGHTMT